MALMVATQYLTPLHLQAAVAVVDSLVLVAAVVLAAVEPVSEMQQAQQVRLTKVTQAVLVHLTRTLAVAVEQVR
jgi:hypothetical protein